MTGESAARIRAIAIAAHNGDTGPARRARAHPDPVVRVAALGALARAGGLDDDMLRAALADLEPSVRRRACELAAGHLAVDVRPALADDEPLVAEAAAWALGEQGEHAPGTTLATDAVAALAGVAGEHSDPLVREAAVAALGAIGDPAGLAAILTAIGDVVTVRRRAVLALAPFEGPDVLAALETAARDRDWQVRNAANDLLRSEIDS